MVVHFEDVRLLGWLKIRTQGGRAIAWHLLLVFLAGVDDLLGWSNSVVQLLEVSLGIGQRAAPDAANTRRVFILSLEKLRERLLPLGGVSVVDQEWSTEIRCVRVGDGLADTIEVRQCFRTCCRAGLARVVRGCGSWRC